MKVMLLLGVGVLLAVVLLAGCQSSDPTTNTTVTLEPFLIEQDGTFSTGECLLHGTSDTILMLESQYCGHCKQTLPHFLSACQAKNVTCEVIDISSEEGKEQMQTYGLSIRYTPTFIFGCDYYVGAKTQSEYLGLIDEFLLAQEQPLQEGQVS